MTRMTEGKYLCVYCGGSDRADPQYYRAAKDFGKLIATNGFNMVYGGGRLGLMGCVSKAVIENGGNVIGITTQQLKEREGFQDGLSQIHIVDTMHIRKQQMAAKADAFFILPGGFGTLDEFFEIFTWRQLNLHQKPIILLNISGYWDPLVSLFYHIIDSNFAHNEHKQFLHIEDSLDSAIATAKKLLNEV